MSLISNLSDKELSELCAIITPKELKEYFKKNPRAFNKIKPGFRPDSLSDNDIVSIIVANREDPFIEAFFDNNVPLLLKHIEESMPSFDEGQTTDYSELSKGLKQTPFSKTPSLYFKLTSRTYPNDTAKEVEKLMKHNSSGANSKKITVNKAKNSHADSSQEILALQETVASLQRENNEYQEKIKDLQNDYSQLKEQFQYQDKPFDLSSIFSEYEHLSIGVITKSSYDDKRWVSRLADIDSTGSVTRFEKDTDQQALFSNRDRLYFKEEELPDGLLGTWAWYTKPNEKNPELDFVTSKYYFQYSPIEVLIFEDCASTDDVLNKLTNGLVTAPSSHRFALAYYNYKTDNYIGVVCKSSEIEHVNNSIRLKKSIISLPVYSFSINELIMLNDTQGIYSKIHLGPANSIIKTTSDSDIVKKIILESIPWSLFKQRGASRAEWQGFKKFLDELKTDDLISSISSTLNCSAEEANKHVDDFTERASTYIDASSIDDGILKAVIEEDSELMSKCVALAEEKWIANNSSIIEKANKELNEIQNRITTANEELSSIKEECKKEKEAAAPYKELIEAGESLAENVQEKVSNRINAARKDASDFIAEMAFLYPSDTASHTAPQPIIHTPFFKSGLEVEAPEEIESWEDAVDLISYGLADAGVSRDKANGLAEYLYSVYFDRIPVLFVGPNGSSIIDALSAALFGRTAGTLTLPDNYDQEVFDECLHSNSKVIKIINPINNSWIPHLPELLQNSGIYFCAVYPFAEDIQFEPNSLCNLFLPLYTELFVDAAPTNMFIGGTISSNYEEFEVPTSEEIPYARDIAKLHSSLLVRKRMQDLLSYLYEMNNGSFEDTAFSTLILPYALTTQQVELAKEIMDESLRISKDLQNELSQVWGDFE